MNVKVIVGTFNQEKAIIGAFTVISNIRLDLRFKLYSAGKPGGSRVMESAARCRQRDEVK